jgi:NAD+ synthase
MSDRLTIALAQLNPTMGAIEANAELIREARATAASQGADLVVGTELCITGYPPEDLVLKPSFLAAARAAVEALAAETGDGGPALLVSAPWHGGEIQALRTKHELPNYSVFDEKRVFKAGPLPGPVNFRGVRLGVMICEDMWVPDVAECLEESGAEILVVPNGSPYEMDKFDQRLQLAVARVTETSTAPPSCSTPDAGCAPSCRPSKPPWSRPTGGAVWRTSGPARTRR